EFKYGKRQVGRTGSSGRLPPLFAPNAETTVRGENDALATIRRCYSVGQFDGVARTFGSPEDSNAACLLQRRSQTGFGSLRGNFHWSYWSSTTSPPTSSGCGSCGGREKRGPV